MKELLRDLEMGLVLAAYYIEDHSGDSNQKQFKSDYDDFIKAKKAFDKIKEILK